MKRGDERNRMVHEETEGGRGEGGGSTEQKINARMVRNSSGTDPTATITVNVTRIRAMGTVQKASTCLHLLQVEVQATRRRGGGGGFGRGTGGKERVVGDVVCTRLRTRPAAVMAAVRSAGGLGVVEAQIARGHNRVSRNNSPL